MKSNQLKYFILFFSLTMFFGGMFQKVILPFFFPKLHWGEGLMAGRDWVFFHLQALDIYHTLIKEGLTHFLQIFNQNRIASSIAIVYYLISPSPFSFLIINSLLYSGSILLMRKLSAIHNKYFIFVLLFIFFGLPSTLILYSQLHKDIFTLFSLALLLTAFLAKSKINHSALIAFSFFTCWLNRPYQLQVFFVGFLFYYVSLYLIKKISAKDFILYFTFSALFFAYLNFQNSVSELPEVKSYSSVRQTENPTAWQKTPFFPNALDKHFYAISNFRNGMIQLKKENDSSIDVNIRFNSSSDLIKYIPRSLLIGFLAPFPNFWLRSWEKTTGNNSVIERTVASLEMLVAYAIYGLFLISLFFKKPEKIIIIQIALITILIIPLALVFTNLGTLYRMRLPYMLTLLTILLSHSLRSLPYFRSKFKD